MEFGRRPWLQKSHHLYLRQLALCDTERNMVTIDFLSTKYYSEIMNKKLIAIFYAIAAAAFYALNVPCSKILLGHISPVFMAGLLYIGAGFGVGILYLFHIKHEPQSERLDRNDFPYTLGMVLLDIVAPILLMFGVKYGTSSNASLLGNFEIVATTLIAFFIFRERVSLCLWLAIFLLRCPVSSSRLKISKLLFFQLVPFSSLAQQSVGV